MMQVQLGQENRGERNLEVYSRPAEVKDDVDQSWALHATGTIRSGTADRDSKQPVDFAPIDRRMSRQIEEAASGRHARKAPNI